MTGKHFNRYEYHAIFLSLCSRNTFLNHPTTTLRLLNQLRTTAIVVIITSPTQIWVFQPAIGPIIYHIAACNIRIVRERVAASIEFGESCASISTVLQTVCNNSSDVSGSIVCVIFAEVLRLVPCRDNGLACCILGWTWIFDPVHSWRYWGKKVTGNLWAEIDTNWSRRKRTLVLEWALRP